MIPFPYAWMIDAPSGACARLRAVEDESTRGATFGSRKESRVVRQKTAKDRLSRAGVVILRPQYDAMAGED